MAAAIQTGLEVFLKKEHKRFQKLRLGVLCNQASVDRNLRHASELLLDKSLKLNITCFFGPQHGIRGEKQDNMIESQDFVDNVTNRPVFSLYGETRIPTQHMMENIDAFVVDLQDVGTRIYTFMYTMENCMRAAKNNGKKVIVLDRPNPIGGTLVEGNVLDMQFKSFVGQAPLATRHGMTMGELALFFNEELEIGCDLEVIQLKNWNRKMDAYTWGRDFVAPSPNMPTIAAAEIFPGGVHFEGALISEGRGTTKPFEQTGAPFIQPDALAKEMNKKKLPGVYFRPVFFQPTYQKCKDTVCGGVHIHILNHKTFLPFQSGIELLGQIAKMYPGELKWKQPPYEYEFEKNPLDLITGTDALRLEIETKREVKKFLEKSKKEATAFLKVRKNYLLYK